MVAHSAVADGNRYPLAPAATRLDLHYLRASGIAQARLQVAALSGNRRRVLEQIDRLVAIDRQLQQVATGQVALVPPPEALEAELADERLALASEKLVLAAGIELPRLEPDFGAELAAALPPEDPVEVVAEETVRRRLAFVAAGALALLVLCVALGAALVQL